MDYKIGSFYNFSTYAPAVLGQNHQKMQLIAMGGYVLGKMFDNVDVRLNSIVGYLNPDSVVTADKDTYLVFQTEAGSRLVFGMTWINQSTVESFSNSVVTVVVESASNEDAARIRQILAAAGYNKVTTKVSSVIST